MEALRGQRFVEGNFDAATALSRVVTLAELEPGAPVMSQGSADNDLVAIISGSVSVLVNGRKVAERRAGQHVGEMALIDTAQARSATIIANELTVVARIAEADFTPIADRFPRIWRALACEIGARLRERGRFHPPPNDRPHIFIGSSAESLPIATAIRTGLVREPVVPMLWSRGVFEASKTSIEALERAAKKADFAALVFSPDDKLFSRGAESAAPRDNVVFELGLFMGALGRDRTFIVKPHGTEVRIPSDLLGVTPVTYESGQASIETRLAPVIEEVLGIMRHRGPK